MKNGFLEHCLSKKVLFFTGKGGVGKSAVTWATAAALARRGRRVAVCALSSFDEVTRPVLDSAVTGNTAIAWYPLEPLACFREYCLQILKFEKVYDAVFDNPVLKTFLRVTPGLAETVTAGKIWNLYDGHSTDHILVDLPASGHAIRFFTSPAGAQRVFRRGFVHREAERICELFRSSETAVEIVTQPEELPVLETLELAPRLASELGLHLGHLLINQCTPEFALSEAELQALPLYSQRKANEAKWLADLGALQLPQHRLPYFAEFDTNRVVALLAEAVA